MIQAESVREYVEKAKKNRFIKGFSPEAISKSVNISKDSAISECMELVNEGVLSVQYKLICPKCFSIVDISESIEKLKGITECIDCENDEFDESDVEKEFVLIR